MDQGLGEVYSFEFKEGYYLLNGIHKDGTLLGYWAIPHEYLRGEKCNSNTVEHYERRYHELLHNPHQVRIRDVMILVGKNTPDGRVQVQYLAKSPKFTANKKVIEYGKESVTTDYETYEEM